MDQPSVDQTIRVGTAGWALPSAFANRFAGADSHLARYARVFTAVEINSSFYRAHLRSTYARWAASVPTDFRFSVKMPKTVTHEQRLVAGDAYLDAFFHQIAALGQRLGCVLVQLPPSLDFVRPVADAFFATLRSRYEGAVAVEPRHSTWFVPEATVLLERYRCARVAADPARVPAAAEPAAWHGLEYWRLHGSPRVYASSYDDAYLANLAVHLARTRCLGRPAWCIFDNTMFGAALSNALALQQCLVDSGTSTAQLPQRH